MIDVKILILNNTSMGVKQVLIVVFLKQATNDKVFFYIIWDFQLGFEIASTISLTKRIATDGAIS